MTTSSKKKATAKAAADGSTRFVSLATGKFVTVAYALRNPDKVAEGVKFIPAGATVVADTGSTKAKRPTKTKKKAKKKTRTVKRKRNGTFANKNATGGNVRCDIIDAIPTPRSKKVALKKAEKAVKKATKAVAVAKKASKKADAAVVHATKLTDAIGDSTAALAKAKRPGVKVANKKVAKKLGHTGTRGG